MPVCLEEVECMMVYCEEISCYWSDSVCVCVCVQYVSVPYSI